MKRSRSRLRRAGRGSVALIALLLISSGMLRLVSGVAMAKDAELPAQPLPAIVKASDTTAEDAAKPAMRTPATRAETASLLDALRAREAQVAEKERQIDLRSKALATADEEITRRLAALQEAEARLRSTIALADGAAEDDLARLTSVYESMKPKDAAALFETMEPGFAAGFLGRMRPDKAAAIMTGLSPDIAYSISVILAGRNANAPKT